MTELFIGLGLLMFIFILTLLFENSANDKMIKKLIDLNEKLIEENRKMIKSQEEILKKYDELLKIVENLKIELTTNQLFG